MYCVSLGQPYATVLHLSEKWLTPCHFFPSQHLVHAFGAALFLPVGVVRSANRELRTDLISRTPDHNRTYGLTPAFESTLCPWLGAGTLPLKPPQRPSQGLGYSDRFFCPPGELGYKANPFACNYRKGFFSGRKELGFRDVFFGRPLEGSLIRSLVRRRALLRCLGRGVPFQGQPERGLGMVSWLFLSHNLDQ